jgi:hypothetical protein
MGLLDPEILYWGDPWRMHTEGQTPDGTLGPWDCFMYSMFYQWVSWTQKILWLLDMGLWDPALFEPFHSLLVGLLYPWVSRLGYERPQESLVGLLDPTLIEGQDNTPDSVLRQHSIVWGIPLHTSGSPTYENVGSVGPKSESRVSWTQSWLRYMRTLLTVFWDSSIVRSNPLPTTSGSPGPRSV